MNVFVLLLATLLLGPAPQAEETRARDLAAARALFERNVAAIQERDREAYLACYLESADLVRTGPDGPRFGWTELAEGTPATGSEDWPDELVARDLRLAWLADGLVYGTYRYRVRTGGDVDAGISERFFRRTPTGWRIAVSTAFSAGPNVPAPPLALVGATLHDGNGGPPIPDAVVVVRGGVFESVGPRATTPVPSGVEVIDLAGKFLAPGLVDAHVHYSQTGWVDGRPDTRDPGEDFPYQVVAAELEREPERFHRAFLASGVTAVFDVGGFPWTRRLGSATEASTLAPHVAATGPLLSTFVPEALTLPDRSQFVPMESEEGVRLAVRSHAAAGSDAIKVWFVLRGPEDLERFTSLVYVAGEEARAVGLPLVVHATELEAARVAIRAGASLLVHSVENAPVDEAFVAEALASGVVYCPTLIVGSGYVSIHRAQLAAGIEEQLAWVHPAVRERVLRTPELGASAPGDVLERLAARVADGRRTMDANLRTLHAAGVPIALGTDAGNPLTLHGPSYFVEAEAMQAAGLAPLAVLTAATRDAARAMGRGHDLGLVAPDRIADLVVLDGDPAADVANLRRLTHVMRAGALQTRETARPR